MPNDRHHVKLGSQHPNWLAVCLVSSLVSAIVLLLGVGIAVNWPKPGPIDYARERQSDILSSTSAALKQSIEATELPAQEKVQIGLQLDRMTMAFREKRLSSAQLGEIAMHLIDSPLMTTLVASVIERKYVVNSGLTENEKAEGTRILQRFTRGAIDSMISKSGIDAAMVHVADGQVDGNWALREHVSDEDLRAFFAAAKKEADEAGVETEPEEVDPSDEFERIIGEALDNADGVATLGVEPAP